jgi:hypothetical protein
LKVLETVDESHKPQIQAKTIYDSLKELEMRHGIVHLDSIAYKGEERLVIGKLDKEKLQVHFLVLIYAALFFFWRDQE